MELTRRNFLKSSGGLALAATFYQWAAANPVLAGSMKEGYLKNLDARPHSEMNIKVALIMQQMAAQSNQGVVQGWNDWLERKGYTKQWDAPLQDAEGEVPKAAAMLEDAVAKKVDAIVGGLLNTQELAGPLATVKQSGIPLFTVDAGWMDPALCDIASNNYLMGAQTGEFLIQEMLGRGLAQGNIARITANFHHGTRKRGKVLTEILSENQGIKTLDERILQYQGFYETTLNAVTDFLTAHGDNLHAVWCPWDEPAMATAQAIQQSGRTVKNCFCVGADGHIPAVDKMREDPDYPMMATTSQSFPLWGNMVAYFVEQIAGLKKPVKEVVPLPIINLPTPLLVKGFNLPPADMPTWLWEDMYTVFMRQALGEVK